jgi:hypothetical protein
LVIANKSGSRRSPEEGAQILADDFDEADEN